MKYSVLSIPPFDKQLKRLAKKYPSLKADFSAMLDLLEEQPEHGTPLGRNCYKVRLAIASKGKGKSGGARIVTNFFIAENIVYLLTIYDKSEKEDLSDKELTALLKKVPY